MRLLLAAATSALLAGCAPFVNHTAEVDKICGARQPATAAIDCTISEIRAKGYEGGRDSDIIGLYLADLALLKSKLASGAMTDAEARVRMARDRVQLGGVSNQRTQAALQGLSAAGAAMRAAQPQTVNCTSFAAGPYLHTNCQ